MAMSTLGKDIMRELDLIPCTRPMLATAAAMTIPKGAKMKKPGFEQHKRRVILRVMRSGKTAPSGSHGDAWGSVDIPV